MNAKKITVTYILTEEQTERLEKITETWNSTNKASDTPSTPEGLFEFMMELGSLHTINKKMDFFEEYANRMAKKRS